MEQRVSLVTLCVRDLAVSRSFSRRLGWTESPPSNDDVAFFQCGGLVFALWGRDALVGDARLDGPGHGFSNTCLAHNVRTKAEVDTTLGQAQTAGATILKPAQDYSGAATPATSRTPTASPGRSRGTPVSRSCRTGGSSFLSDSDVVPRGPGKTGRRTGFAQRLRPPNRPSRTVNSSLTKH